MLDPTQIILAVIAIIGTVIATLQAAFGAVLVFVGKYFVDQIAKLQAENKADRDTFTKTIAAIAGPLNILVDDEKEHVANTKASLDDIRILAEGNNERRTTTRRSSK